MMASELADEQKKDLFSTHPVLDSTPTRFMSIQKDIKLDKMDKVQIARPISILDHINMSTYSINSTQSVSGTKSSILDHNRFHEAKLVRSLLRKCAYLMTFLDFGTK